MKVYCAIFCALLAACGSTAAPAGSPADSTEIDAAAEVAGTDAIAVGPCSGAAVAAGSQVIELQSGGIARKYILHIPLGYSNTTAKPLIVNFHGYTSNAAGEEDFSGMDVTSDANGFLVAYPDGIASSWNAGVCCGDASKNGIDDVGFTRALVADIQSRVCVDAKRIYATGMSNGGFFTHRLGCEAADLFAAIAPVAGVNITFDCNPARPMPIIDFHGTDDQLVPYGGNSKNFQPGVVDTFKNWGERNGCTDAPSESFHHDSATCQTYAKCKSGVKVTLCTLTGEGHCWPGPATCMYGVPDADLSANDAMWTFFQEFSLP